MISDTGFKTPNFFKGDDMRVTISTVFSAAAMVIIFYGSSFALNNGLAKTPQMGFNTWNWFGCDGNSDLGPHGDVTDTVILQLANALITTGMKDCGYTYVNYDDCWAEPSRDARGALVPRHTAFTRGIRFVTDSIHKMGLGFGLYGDASNFTCAQTMPGQLGHEQQDADSFVAWGVDYFKYDWCGRSGNAEPDYTLFRNCIRTAIAKATTAGKNPRQICFSVCNWGQGTVPPWIWGDSVGNSWRTTYDILCNWSKVIDQCYAQNVVLFQYAKPGSWNDADMLEVGNGMTLTEDQTHFALWCMMASPLLAGNDIRNMNASIKGILTNKEVIAVSQDSLGFQCRRVQVNGSLEVLAKKLNSSTPGVAVPDYAILFLNRGTSSANMSVIMDSIWKADPSGPKLSKNSTYKVRNLITKTQLPNQLGNVAFTATAVPGHGCQLIRLTLDTLVTGVSPVNTVAGYSIPQIRSAGNTIIITGASANTAVSLFDCKGSLLYKKTFSEISDMEIPLTFSKGVYIVNSISNNVSTARKVIVR
jgi:alpha-galactosidase